ncbi:MAG: hypothetical protein IJV27_05735 [Prevotella sp.]|nr:hypothetical protein [Prevotella sp.]
MNTEIFKNARFGDRFLDASGQKAVFLRFWGNPRKSAILYIEKFGEKEFALNGVLEGGTNPTQWDIVKQCRADGWEPLPTEHERIATEFSASREMLANCPDDVLMRTSLENRIKMLEDELKNLPE